MKKIVVFVLLFFTIGLSAQAQSPSVFNSSRQINLPTIAAIDIVGTQRVEDSTVLSYMSVKQGDPFDPQLIDESLKRLFGTGLFSDVRMRREGSNLIVHVTENPIINRISFEGNERMEDGVLSTEIQLRPRFVYTSKKVSEDTQRILDIYRRSGRFGATVEPQIIKLPQNRVDLVFEINEGDLTYVRRILFHGNRHFSDSTLRDEVSTKERAFYRILTSNDTYDPDRLNFDRELLRRFYLKEGYADFKVASLVAELSPNKRDFYVTFNVDEGNRYKVGTVNIDSKLRNINTDTLKDAITSTAGEWYNAVDVDTSVDKLTDQLGDLGYAFVDVDTKIDRDPEAHTLNIAYVLKEGPKVYVERIDVEGNVRTLDRVIRREFELQEGDAFNTSKLRRTRRNLNNLGFFESIKVEPIPGSEPDRTILKTTVAEQSTGDLSFGAGFSTTESLLGNVRIRERNLLGKGQDLRLSGTFSGRRTEFDLGFTEPYFMGRKLSAGFDLFSTTRKLNRNSSFDEKRLGGGLRLGYLINENISQKISYKAEEVSVANVSASASRFIKDQQGTFTTSEIGQSLLYDTRDNRFTPSNGTFMRLGTFVAGLGGNVKYMKITAAGGHYIPLDEDWVLSASGRVGVIEGYGGEDVLISDRFFVGSKDLRGFQLAGIGPRDLTTDDALGGNVFATSSVQLKFPLGLPDELAVNGSLFFDAGTLTSIDSGGPEVADSGLIRTSVGVGLAWRSPFGPIRIDFAIPITKEEYDKEEPVSFNFGTQF